MGSTIDRLDQLVKKPGDQLLFTKFVPHHVSMIIIEDQDVALKKRIEQDDADKRIGRIW